MYREVAGLLFAQLEAGELNPAKIINHFMEPEQQREAASLFNSNLQVDGKQEMQKALNETVYRIMENSVNQKNAELNPADIAGLQQVIMAKRRLEDIRKVHISFE